MIVSITKLLQSLLKLLQSSTSAWALAVGCGIGFLWGAAQGTFVYSGLLILVFLIFNISIAAGILGAGLGAFFGVLTWPVANALGENLLTASTLQSFWTSTLSLPVISWLDLDYTAVCGAYVLSWILVGPVIWACKRFVCAYRDHLHASWSKHPLVKAISMSKWGRWVYKIWSLFL